MASQPAWAGSFTIVQITDQQRFPVPSQGYQNQIDWIERERENLNIIAVLNTGDIVQMPNDGIGTCQGGSNRGATCDVGGSICKGGGTCRANDAWNCDDGDCQWIEAARYKDQLVAARIPYLVVAGNHDSGRADDGFPFYGREDNTSYLTYFPRSFHRSQPGWLATNPGKAACDLDDYRANADPDLDTPNGAGLSNAWIIPSTLGFDILFIGLHWTARQPDCHVQWANDIIDLYPDYPVFLFSHEMMDSGTDREPGASGVLCYPDPRPSAKPDVMDWNRRWWEELVSKREQVFFALGGHHTGDDGKRGNGCWVNYGGDAQNHQAHPASTSHRFTAMYANWESLAGTRGQGRMRVLTFHETGNSVDGGGWVQVRTIDCGTGTPLSCRWLTAPGTGPPYHEKTEQAEILMPVRGLGHRQRSNPSPPMDASR